VEITDEVKTMQAEKTRTLQFKDEKTFSGESLGIFAFLPLIIEYGKTSTS
jgi:hypothetical protein